MRKFVGIDFFEEDAPDATTLFKFRHLLEKNNLNKAFFETINRVMVASGHVMKGGTIVDATIINAQICTCLHEQDDLLESKKFSNRTYYVYLEL